MSKVKGVLVCDVSRLKSPSEEVLLTYCANMKRHRTTEQFKLPLATYMETNEQLRDNFKYRLLNIIQIMFTSVII